MCIFFGHTDSEYQKTYCRKFVFAEDCVAPVNQYINQVNCLKCVENYLEEADNHNTSYKWVSLDQVLKIKKLLVFKKDFKKAIE